MRFPHVDFSVEPPRSNQRLIERGLGGVGRSDKNNIVSSAVEAVHLNQKLILSAVRFFGSTKSAEGSSPSDDVQFINEHNAGPVRLSQQPGAFRHLTHAGGPDAHKNFDELRTGDG